jgi:hypothetical protein
MKRHLLTTAYVATAMLAAYASYDLMAEVVSVSHFGVLARALSGVAVFAVLTGALWATVAQIVPAVAMARQFSWRFNLLRVFGFIVGVGAGAWGMTGALNDVPDWQIGIAILAGFIGMCIFGFVTLFAPRRVPASTPAH